MDGGAGILHKEIKMYVRCCDVCEEETERLYGSNKCERGNIGPSRSLLREGKSSEVQRSRAVPVSLTGMNGMGRPWPFMHAPSTSPTSPSLSVGNI